MEASGDETMPVKQIIDSHFRSQLSALSTNQRDYDRRWQTEHTHYKETMQQLKDSQSLRSKPDGWLKI